MTRTSAILTGVMDLIAHLHSAVADRYAIERELGRGGMATVFLARDLRHERNVAIKVLHPDIAHTVGAERFLQEIRLAARLSHPHRKAAVEESWSSRQRGLSTGTSAIPRLRRCAAPLGLTQASAA